MGTEITCVILNYNDSETTLNLLDLIRHYESIDHIVVVDNCSTDASYENLCRYRSSRIHVTRTPYNGGYGFGNNWGVRYAINTFDSEFVLIANPDVEFSDECVRAMRAAFDALDRVAVAAPIMNDRQMCRHESIVYFIPNLWQDLVLASVLLAKLFPVRLGLPRHRISAESDYVDVEMVPGSLLMVRTSAFIDAGMFDEEFFLYGEEKVLGTKLRERGYRTVLVTTQQYLHMHSVSINRSIRSFIDRRKYLIESKLLYARKYRKLGPIPLSLIQAYFRIVLLEAYLIALLNKVRGTRDSLT